MKLQEISQDFTFRTQILCENLVKLTSVCYFNIDNDDASGEDVFSPKCMHFMNLYRKTLPLKTFDFFFFLEICNIKVINTF